MAARFWVGAAGNWSDTAHWSLTTGGAGGQVVPSAADDVTFDGAGNTDCVLDTATAKVAKTLTIASGYTSTLTYNVNLSVSGSITTANSAHTMTGAGLLRMIAAGTWTTNGKTVGVPVEIGGTTTFTCTFADAPTFPALTLTNTTSTIFSGAFLLTAASCTISGTQTVTIANNVQITGITTSADANIITGAFEWRLAGLTNTGGMSTGTATIVFNGTGTWSGNSVFANDIKIDTAGTLTVSGTVQWGSGTATKVMTYVTGTVVTTGSTLSIGFNTTLNTSSITWNNISLSGSITVGGQALSITGTLTVATGMTISQAVTVGILSLGASLTLSSACTATTVTFTAASTLTLNGLLTVTGTMTLPNAAVAFAGTAGWTVGTFTNTTITATRIWTFKAGNTYTVLTAMDTQHAAAQTVRFSWVSSTPGTRYSITLGTGATQDNGFIDATDIDSSLGQIVFSYHGVLSNCLNWATAFLVNSGIARPTYQLGV